MEKILSRMQLYLIKTRLWISLTIIIVTSLGTFASGTEMGSQIVTTVKHGLVMSIFNARSPNPVPDIAPPLKEPEKVPVVVLETALPSAQPQLTEKGTKGRSGDIPLVKARGRMSADLPGGSSPASGTTGALLGSVEKMPVYSSFDFLTGYLSNLNYPIIVDGKPWDVGSTNMEQLRAKGGGTSYWDYWSEGEPWDSPNHLWLDDHGHAFTYRTETVKDASGKSATAYVLVDRQGPGVMDKLWFTHDPTQSFMGVLLQSSVFFWTIDPPEVTEWGSLAKLGNLRIEVDGRAVYDGPILKWFSGDAQQLPPVLKKVLTWHYRQMGSDGNIVPITYLNSLKVSVYGGTGKPKWFMATGMTLPPGTLVKPYAGTANDLPLKEMEQLAQNILSPESFINALDYQRTDDQSVQAGAPASLAFDGAGTVAALQFQIEKQYDPRRLWLKIKYGDETGLDLPLLAFFSEPDQISLHHSSPIGVIDADKSYIFYTNMPMPFQNGMTIQLSTNSATPIPVKVKIATLNRTTNTQLRALYEPEQKLTVHGPDFSMNVEGSGKMVGLVFTSKDQQFDLVPKVMDEKTGEEDNAKKIWPMGYLEGNLTIVDGEGNSRYYSGQEDWAEGGYYFNSGYTTPPGGSNMPFAGILRYQGGRDGFAVLFRYFNDLSAFRFKNGLHLSFGHGTWQNNFPVTYGATLFYYHEIPGAAITHLQPVEDATLSISRRVRDTGP